MKPRIIYMGTPEFAVAPLEAILNSGYEVAAVVTVPDKPSGRGLKLNESAVKQFAVSKGLDVLQPVSLKDPEFLSALENYNADLFIVVAFRMLPKIVWSMPKMGTFNLHGSLLPKYRGAAPINWAIINGEKNTGVTTFFIDEKIDTGNILLRESTEIGEHENVGSLYERLMSIGANLVVKTVEGITNNTLTPKPQSDFEEGVCEAPKLTKELCRINWEKSAVEIDRLIRGLSPYPAAFSTISNGEKNFDIKIFDVTPVDKNSQSDNINESLVGTIQTDNKNYIHITCGNGVISLNEIQLAGKKRMRVKEFLLGFRNIGDYKFIQ